MEMVAKEVHSISNNNREFKSTGVSCDSTWNSRGWQSKEKSCCCYSPEDWENNRYCEKKIRDNSKMTATEYMEWFIDYYCSLNHTGSPQE